MIRFMRALALGLSLLIALAGCGILKPKPGSIIGALTFAGSTDAPAAATLALDPPAGESAYANGVYTITDVPPGDYVLTASADGCASAGVAVTVTAGGEAAKDLVLVSNSGLLAYYPFAGNADDASGHDKGGAAQGHAAPAADMFGRPGNAYAFDGVDDYITVPSLWDDPAAFTFAAWVKPEAVGISQCKYIFHHQDGGWFTLCQNLCYYAADILVVAPESPIPFARFPVNADCALAAWQHVAVAWSKGRYLKLYVDGNLVDTESLSGAANGANGLDDNNCLPCYIGVDNSGNTTCNYPFDGLLDEIRVYGRALSAEEVAALARR